MSERVRESGREWRQRILDSAAPHLAAGEQPRVLAIAQYISPWLNFLAIGAGCAMVQGGLIGETYLPGVVGILGVPVAALGCLGLGLTPRRAIVRTDRRILIFALNRDTKNPQVEIEQEVELDRLPIKWDGGIHLGGRTLYAWNSSGRDRQALKSAFAVDPEDPEE